MNTLFELVVTILLFTVLFIIAKYIFERLGDSDNRLLNSEEYLPEEEIQTLKQVYYLIMMLILFTFILYIIIYEGKDFFGIAVLEIIVSLLIALTLDYSSWKNRILFLLLIPYGAITFILFKDSLVVYFDTIHIFVYAYFMKVYYDKFKEYTAANSLGITIILLFTIIFLSFINTTIVESVEPLNALVMVSNAFTSNGYVILGNTSLGKINSIILVWSGYILSGVATATLAAAIILRSSKKREKELNRRLDALEELIKKNQEN